MANQVLTDEEIGHIKNGYRHIVDNGYSPLATAKDLLKAFAVYIEASKRELLIGKQDGFNCEFQIKLLEANELLFKALAGRVID